VWARGGQRFHRGAHIFPGQLDRVQHPDRRDHVRRIVALLAARLDQPSAASRSSSASSTVSSSSWAVIRARNSLSTL
jgi:hypothetical protein